MMIILEHIKKIGCRVFPQPSKVSVQNDLLQKKKPTVFFNKLLTSIFGEKTPKNEQSLISQILAKGNSEYTIKASERELTNLYKQKTSTILAKITAPFQPKDSYKLIIKNNRLEIYRNDQLISDEEKSEIIDKMLIYENNQYIKQLIPTLHFIGNIVDFLYKLRY